MVTKRLLPVTRVHEPMLVDLEVSGGIITDAKCSGLMFRGFENMMKGRDPKDSIFFTQRICGICSSAHGIAASFALEDAYKLKPTNNGRILKNIIFGADIIQNHLRHLYVLVSPDYVKLPEIAPFAPQPESGYRLPEAQNKKLTASYFKAIEMSAKAHQLMAIFGAKAPHQQTIYPTGVSVSPEPERINSAASILRELMDFADQVIEDFGIIANYYEDYFEIGRGYGNFLSYGMFPEDEKGKRFFSAGIVQNLGEVKKVNPDEITESVKYSWYKDDLKERKPVNGLTDPEIDKEGAYSWVKAPRYNGVPFEGGPLARGWIKGTYTNGVSVMDRLLARAQEIKLIGGEMKKWLDQLEPSQPPLIRYESSEDAEGVGLTDAMRGALGHWLKIRNGKLEHYQIVTPTAWNFSPRGADNKRGPVEEALVGTPVEDPDNLLEVGRVIRCFDPCFTCAVHLIDVDKPLGKEFII